MRSSSIATSTIASAARPDVGDPLQILMPIGITFAGELSIRVGGDLTGLGVLQRADLADLDRHAARLADDDGQVR